ncbi:DUF7507 domain-containing protein [Paenibacillus glycanilyticus]|uniref:DUF7507 domain-containing protein n=1 Tax=Paenibacillus glycanilyticus TaxID=126569 RepID=UPI003EBC843B
MPFVNRFFLNETGGATFTGNTLGLSRSDTVAKPGTVDSIGAFITTDTSVQYGTYPPGTTSSFQLNSSSAVLVLPPGATILYAELIWGGTYINNGVNLTAFINNPVSLRTPSGLNSVAPDPATSFQVALSSTTLAYVRSAEVTSLVSSAGAGTYTTGGVVGTIVIPDPTSNHAGWTLAVFYRDPASPLRNLSLRVGATVIQATSGPVDTVITGFATPLSGTLNGRTMIGAQEGDANKTGDKYLFGPSVGSLTALSGPNNLANNFFASQINKDDGTLDTSGTFGTRNQINGNPGTNIIGGRQGWDITNVTISSTLSNAQTSAVFRLTTNGDGYLVDSVGIQVDIETPLLDVTKTSTSSAAIVGDIVTYNISIKNSGQVDATSVVLFDTSISDTMLVPGSVKVNGQPVADDPVVGIPIGTISAGSTIPVSFQVLVTGLPIPPFLKDQATAAYTFQPTPDSPPISTVVPSGIVTIPVFQPAVEVFKSADLTSANIGDIITYTLEVTNTGNIDVTAVVTDPLPAGTNFVTDSVFVNDTNRPGANPSSGINLGVIAVGQLVTIRYQLRVVSVPPGNIVHNAFNTAYEATLPDQRVIPGFIVSNPVDIPVSSPVIDPVKTANLPSIVVGETVTYSVTFTNNNASPLTNVVIKDNVPPGSQFVVDSVTVNGNPSPGSGPLAGIPVGTVNEGETVLVTFQLLAVSLPNPPVLNDQATVTFSSGGFTASSITNEVSIPVVEPGISLVKRAGVSAATVGDTINYSVTVTNTGNTSIIADVFDPLNSFSAFVPGTARVNGNLTAADPVTGISTGPIAPGTEVIVSYDVLLVGQPPEQFYQDQANASFVYTPPGRPVQSGSGVSNIVRVEDPLFAVAIDKSVSTTFALVGQKITYTILVTNLSPASITNTVVTDSALSGAAVVAGSTAVNGIPVPGDLTSGIPIGAVPAGATVAITFDAVVTSIPEPDGAINNFASAAYTSAGVSHTIVSNTVTVTVTQPSVTAAKKAFQSYAVVGDFITYEVTVRNDGPYNAVVTWFDMLPEGTIFIENSLTLNGFSVPGAERYRGTVIGTVEAHSTAVVFFLLKVISYPSSGIIFNQGNLVVDFILPDGQIISERIFTNPVTVTVLPPPVVVKAVNSGEVFVGDSVLYTVTVSNPGLSPIDQVVLKDVIPDGLSFITGSVMVNGINHPMDNPKLGVSLGQIAAKQTARLSFGAIAVSEPVNPLTVNSASITFQYVVPDGTRKPGTADSNPVEVLISEHEE